MARFQGMLKDSKGKAVKQTMVAESVKEAREAWRQKGFVVQEIKEVQGGFDFAEFSLSMQKVTVKDLALFSRQLATLVNAGVSMVRGLGVMVDQCANPRLKAALARVLDDVQQGTNFSDSLRKHPKIFDNLYCAMIQAGETGGVLDDVLARLASLLEDSAKLNNQIKTAMTYPIVVTSIAVLIFLGMCIFIIPVFDGVFKSLGGELPAFTQILVNISNFLKSPSVSIIPITIFVIAFAYKRIYATPPGQLYFDGLFLKLPLFGDLVVKTAVARFARTFGSLSKAGVPILSSLEITGETAGNLVISNAIDSAREAVKEGGQIAPAMEKTQVFPVMALQMISIGEETGEIDKMLMKVADFYENEVEEAVKALTSLMEPLMIIVLGGMVGSIIVGMYLPIFSIMDKIK
ncbi:type II secretion system F family protein [Pseudanabaena sp. FACHB-1277]|uniref:Type II secretion system F family protein n=1 Tax=Pseudanabaena cinerea FACHB-1277 TaxID=2949581 RepID=A0A926Z5C4_9CYAN|nr:type II secretion system F family protein [Pseudanabaena cinerea]MBD2149600.1 type II secretion system F family protein [Pseudanabaena cinerea FACHB-1277]